MIVPGDRKLTAPKTNTGATESPTSVVRRTTVPLARPHPGGCQCEQAEAQKQGGQRPRATHHRLNSCRRSRAWSDHSRTARKTVTSSCADTSTRTVSMVTVIAKTGVSLIRGPVERQRATYA